MTEATTLAVDGYVVVDLLDDDALESARRLVDELDLPTDVPFLATSNDEDRSDATRVQRDVAGLLGPALRGVLPDHRPFIAGCIVKGARPSGPVEPHQDLTYTDERRYRTIIVWAPLQDVGPENGALHVIPGSHRWTSGIRAAGTTTAPTDEHRSSLWDQAVPLQLSAGQAVLYDAGLIHGSSANDSPSPRPVLAAALAPTGADLVHFLQVDGELLGHAVDADWFEQARLVDEPTDRPALQPWTAAVGPRDFDRFVRPRPSGERHTPTQADVTAPNPSRSDPRPPRHRRPLVTTRHAVGLGPASPRQALLDPSLDERLRRDGFVRVPVLNDAATAALRDVYGSLHGWQGAGFEADLTNPDSGYRHEVSSALSARLDEVVCPMFAGYTPYLRAFLCKWPGDDSGLYLHRDWMYVDERRGHRTYVVWIALQDVAADEGQIQVLRHSHRVDPMLRGTNLNGAWIDREPLVRSHLLTVPVRAGEALIMDNALVHCSLPNHSGAPRLVAAIGVRPVEAPLVHFSRRDDLLADRFDVDDEFFLSTTPQDLLTSPPDLPVAESVPTRERDIGAAELAARLYTSPLTQLDGGRRLVAAARRRVGRRRTG